MVYFWALNVHFRILSRLTYDTANSFRSCFLEGLEWGLLSGYLLIL
jgi:hypothetical protein